MANYLFFDTETTGVPRNYRAPVTDSANWPRMVQLGWILTDDTGRELQSGNYIIRPEGFTIPDEAARLHGITTERALAEGVALAEVLSLFRAALAEAGCIVGHNIEFDKNIVGAELCRLKMPYRFTKWRSYCTMQAGTDFCRLRGPYGYKWPKLEELYKKLFGRMFADAHNAFADIQATKECFWEMRCRGLI